MRSYFTRIRGKEEVKNRIGVAIEAGRLPHALLLDGPRGSGKRTLAKEIAAALNCEHKLDRSYSLPCGECNTCRRIREGSFTDVKELEHKSDRSTIGVQEVKDLRADMFLTATESEYKVYLIADAEKMTTEAQNALLVALEEPPRGVVTLLLTESADKILTTIKSRVQYVAMPRLSDRELKEYLLSSSTDAQSLSKRDDKAFDEIVTRAEGCIGAALDMLSPSSVEERRARREITLTFLRATSKKAPYSELYAAVNDLPTKRAELGEAFEDIITALRDMIAVRVAENARLSFFTSREEAAEMAALIGQRRLMPIYDVITAAHSDNAKNANVSALVLSVAAKIRAI